MHAVRLGLVGATFVALAMLTPARAGVIVDQQQPAFNATTGFLNGFQELAQTFTVGTSGVLSGITITVVAGPLNDVSLRVLSTAGGVPGATVLATAVAVPALTFPPYTSTFYDFSSSALWLGAGEVFSFALSATASEGQAVAVEIRDNGTDPYAVGELFTRGASTPFSDWGAFASTITDADFADVRFQIYLEVPAPGALALLVGGLAVIGWRRYAV